MKNKTNDKIDNALVYMHRCVAEDYFTDNQVSGYPVPDQDIDGRWYICNGTSDFIIVKPETIKKMYHE